MIVTLNIIAEKLADLHPLFFSEKMRRFVVDGVMLYYDGAALEAEQVYLLTASQWESLDSDIQKNGHFLLLDDCRLKNRKEQYADAFVLLLDNGNILEVANRVTHIFTRLSAWDRNCHQSIIDGCTLQDITDSLSELCPYPAVVFDPSFRIVSYTKKHTVPVDEFSSVVKIGYTQPERMDVIHQKGMLSRLEHTERCILDSSAIDAKDYVAYRSHAKGNRTVAYSCIFYSSHKATAGELDLAECFFRNLDFYFVETSRFSQASNFMYEYMLSDLINSRKERSQKELTDRLNYIELPKERNFFLFLLDFEDGMSVPFRYLCDQIRMEHTSLKPFLQESDFFVLCPFGGNVQPEEYVKRLSDSFFRFLRKYRFRCYVSNEFSDLPAIYDAAIQCRSLKTLFSEKPLDSEFVYCYKDYWFHHCLCNLEQDMRLSSILSPEYLRLVKADQDAGGRYLPVVKMYLRCNCDYAKTAAELKLHRNTVAYRLQNLCRVAGLDLEDYNTRMALDYSIRIQNYIGNRS